MDHLTELTVHRLDDFAVIGIDGKAHYLPLGLADKLIHSLLNCTDDIMNNKFQDSKFDPIKITMYEEKEFQPTNPTA